MRSGPAVYRADWVVPVSGPPIRNGAVRVDGGGRIEAVGPSDRVAAGGAAVLELGRAAILPGLVNVHAHPELSFLRGRLDGFDFPEWIGQLIDYKYRRLDADSLRLSTELGVAEAIAGGVTCLAAPDDAGHLLPAMVQAGLRGRVYRELFGPEPERADAALAELRAGMDEMRARATDRVEVGIAPHAPYTVSPRLFAAAADYARAEGLPLCIHVAESSAEEEWIRHGRGPFAERLAARGIATPERARSPIAWLDRTGALDPAPLLVHCVRVDAEDIERIAAVGATVAHCPISNARFGHGVAPLIELMEAAVPVGLGSDSVASNDRVDVLEEARAAILFQRTRRSDPGALTAEAALQLATVGGARALGLDDRVGTLEPGKAADLTAVRLDRPHTVPVTDPIASLVYAARASDVRLTVVGGHILYRDGELETIDWAALARSIGERTDGDSVSTG